MLKEYVVAKPFGPYQKGDVVQFSPADAERFKAFLVQPTERKLPEDDRKAPPADRKAPPADRKR